jgi:signal peptidase I
MTKKKTPAPKASAEAKTNAQPATEADDRVEETLPEAVASIASVLVIGLFILTFLCQNFVIPSGSMEKTLLVGDHLVVDRITLAPPSKWMPLVHYREPKRNDIIVFIKPGELDADGKPVDMFLVKRLIGLPGDHIRLHDGIVSINGVAQSLPEDGDNAISNPGEKQYLDEFPSISPADNPNATERWAVDFPRYVENGELVVPAGKYFMMGDHRHSSLDSRYWGFVPRENIVGRPLFNYWSFVTPEDQYEKTGIDNTVAWMSHVALHFFSDTRWKRTLHRVN